PGGNASKGKFSLAMTYAGAPRMFQSEKAFLFLTPEGEIPDSYAVMGFNEGIFSVNKDTAGGEVVMPDMTREAVPTGPGLTRGISHAIPLAEFRKLVESYLK